MNKRRCDYLRRLPHESYRGEAFVHWTMAIDDRRTGWLDERFHAQFRELLLHTLSRHQLIAPCYCLMPDHFHMLLIGLMAESDQRDAVKFFRKHVNRVLRPDYALQLQPHDHVLTENERQREAFGSVAKYIFNNPVRAGLVPEEDVCEWPYSGCLVSGYPDLDPFREGYWYDFWKVYHLVNGHEYLDVA